MDYLWSPWRYRYVTEQSGKDRCFLCDLAASDAADDARNLILCRGRHNLVLLNRYPYNPGHVMVAPYAHVADLIDAEPAALTEMMELSRKLQAALKESYKPHGYNLGINLGRCAGAGVEGHLHLHVLPRWNGDSNFMTVAGETRVLPETLEETYRKLSSYFCR